MNEYKVIVADNIHNLEQQVMQFMNSGWYVIHGAFCVVQHQEYSTTHAGIHYKTKFYQAMIKLEHSELRYIREEEENENRLKEPVGST